MLAEVSEESVIKEQANDSNNPMSRAPACSKFFYWWFRSFIEKSFSKKFSLNDLYKPLPEDDSTLLTNQLEREWNKQLKKNSPSLFGALFFLYGWKMILWSALIFFKEIVKMAQPILIMFLMDYFSGQLGAKYGALFATLLIALALLNIFLNDCYHFHVSHLALRMKFALKGLVYRKVTQIELGSAHEENCQQANDIVENGLDELEYSFFEMPYFGICVVQLIIAIVSIYFLAGAPYLAGLSVLIVVLLLKAMLFSSLPKFKKALERRRSKSVLMIKELILNIESIKLNCWEKPLSMRLARSKKREKGYFGVIQLVNSLASALDKVLMTLGLLLSVIFFLILWPNNSILPKNVILLVGYFMIFHDTMGCKMSLAVTKLYKLRDSLNKCQTFLINQRKARTKTQKVRNLSETDTALIIANLNNEATVEPINIEIKKGELVGIFGPSQSGKTALLLSILGEQEQCEGEISVQGRLSYVSQEPWIFSASLKDNITFGNEFDREKFNTVVKVCSLEQDLELLPFGKDTMIGIDQTGLSPSLKSRISLARAVYDDADIYLIDDTFYSQAVQLNGMIIQECIIDYLKNKTRILVSRSLGRLAGTDRVIVLRNGTTKESTFSELANSESTMSIDDPGSMEFNDLMYTDFNTSLYNDEPESREKVPEYRPYWEFFKASGFFVPILVVFLVLAAQTFIVFCNFWLEDWSTKELLINWGCSSNCTWLAYQDIRQKYLAIYFPLAGIVVFLALSSIISFRFWCLTNSHNLYWSMFNRVRDTYLQFFEFNPLDTILSRFSTDSNQIEQNLSLRLEEFCLASIQAITVYVLSFIAIPYLTIFLFPITLVLLKIGKYSLKTGRRLNKLERSARISVLEHLENTTDGLTTIRAFHKDFLFVDANHEALNRHFMTNFLAQVNFRWLSTRLDLFSWFYLVILLYTCIGFRDELNLKLNAGFVGLMFIYLLQLFDTVPNAMISWIHIEKSKAFFSKKMVSVRRMIDYLSLPSEPHLEGRFRTSIGWPHKGRVDLKNVSLRIGKNQPSIIKNFSFQINPMEKIGIVERPDCGKSWLIRALFQLYKPTGNIIIDYVDTQDLGLYDLRSRIGIISSCYKPFLGTLRFNMDPLNLYSDAKIWAALEAVSLKDRVRAGGLMMQIGTSFDSSKKQSKDDNGGKFSFSPAELDLLGLARALLNECRILVIDEMSVDDQTREIVSRVLRNELRDCTVIRIVRKLESLVTLNDTSQIICLMNGTNSCSGTLRELLLNRQSVFSGLVELISMDDRNHLFEAAGIAI